MYIVYDLHASAKNKTAKFSDTDRYFIVNDTATCRGYGVTLDETISNIATCNTIASEQFVAFLSSLYIIAKVDNLDDLKFLYPEHFI